VSLSLRTASFILVGIGRVDAFVQGTPQVYGVG
jgi:hypothetical protein